MEHFEVERKFTLTDEQQLSLLTGSKFLGIKEIVDIYYDDVNFSLTTKDWWLRQRDGEWELKIPMNQLPHHIRTLDRYQEITDTERIMLALDLNTHRNLFDELKKSSIAPFCIAPTRRAKYTKDGFNIDIDEANFQEFTYRVAEIELVVNSEADMNKAAQEILDFAAQQGLTVTYVRGKIIEYLFRQKPDHFQALIKAGIVPAK